MKRDNHCTALKDYLDRQTKSKIRFHILIQQVFLPPDVEYQVSEVIQLEVITYQRPAISTANLKIDQNETA